MEQVKILLNSKKNVNSVNVDTYQMVEINNKLSEILEYDIRNTISATEIFDAEREANEVYRIYGRIEYLSLLNGLRLNYTGLTNFFLPQTDNIKNIFNSIKFYLVKPTTGYTNIMDGTGTTLQWVRYFEVIGTPSNFELFNAGYSNNVYNEQTYAFNFNIDFDVSSYLDEFGFPLTELFLYAQYQVGQNGEPKNELIKYTNWGTKLSGSAPSVQNPSKSSLSPLALNTGDKIYGDLINYSKPLFYQNQASPQIHYIRMPVIDTNNGGIPLYRYLQFKYNPFTSLQLRYFEESLNSANSGSTSYAERNSIPYYATPIGEGNYVWKNILKQGYNDPLTNQGVDYPFVNKRRYLFASIILDISPDLGDSYTNGVFSEISFGPPTVLNTNPMGDIDNLGKPCQ